MANIHRMVLGSLVTAGSPLRSSAAAAAASANGLSGPTTTTCTRSVCRTRPPRKPRTTPTVVASDATNKSSTVNDTTSPPLGRDPDKWLFKRLLQASAKLWTRSTTQLGTSGTTTGQSPSGRQPQKAEPIDLARAREILDADVQALQATGAGLWRRVRETGRPLWQQTLGVANIGAGMMRKVAQRLGGTDVGRRVGEPVRRFLEESSAAKCERDKYIEEVRSMKGAASGAGK